NLLGVRPTGHAAVALSVVALLPVAALTVVALVGARVAPWTPLAPPGQGVETLGLGLAVLMWNYSGWDTPSTILGETRAPERAFRSAMFLTLPILIAAYLLPVGAALASGALPWSEWTTGVLPTIARSVGGDWLGHAVAAGAVLSTAGLFMSLLLTNSRLPYVLARDHAMPRWLGAVDSRFGTPWKAVVVSAALYAAFAVFSFKELIVLNVWLYSLSLLVELAAFVRLRVVAPEMSRPWRVPGGLAAAVGVVVFPVLCCLGAIATAGWTNTIAVVLRTTHIDPSTRDIDYGETHIFVGSNYVVSVRHGGSLPYVDVRSRCEAAPDLLIKGPGFVLYALMDFIVDQYFPLVDRFEDKLGELEDHIFQQTLTRETTERIYQLKRDLLEVKRAVAPLVDICNRLVRADVTLIPDDARVYFRDVYDHTIRINEMVATLRELLTTALEANLSLISVSQNEAMKRLAGWAAIIAVPTMIAGIYGM